MHLMNRNRSLKRLTALILLALLANTGVLAQGQQESFKSLDGKPCVNRWGQVGWLGPTCEALALKDAHLGQLAALKLASGVLMNASFLPEKADKEAVINALGVNRDSAARLLRDYQPPKLPSGVPPAMDFLANMLDEMRADFVKRGWPAPADLPSGWQFLQDRLRLRYVPDTAAVFEVSSQLALRLLSRYEVLIDEMVKTKTAADFAAYGAAQQTAREADRAANDTYVNRVVDRATGANRFERSDGFFGAMKFWLAFGLALGVLAAWRVRFQGLSSMAQQALPWAIAPVLAAAPVYLLYILTGMSGWVAFGLFLPLFGALFLWAVRLGWSWLPDRGAQTHGSARWAQLNDMLAAGRISPKGQAPVEPGFVLGRAPLKAAANRYDPRFRYLGHVLTCAPTGAGKGVGAVIPNLLEYPGSAFVLDIKGENYAVTARARCAMGQEVFLIDPFAVTGQTGHGFNWLDRLNPNSPDVVSESAALADLLVLPDKHGSDHWDETAKELLRGLLVYVATLDDSRRHMGEVRRILTAGETAFAEVLADMASDPDQACGLPARAANTYLAKADKERSGVLSSAIRHTAFLDDPRICAALARSDFRLDDLKRRPMTVYVAMPPARLAAYARFLRGFVGLSLAAITASSHRPAYKVAFFLDEFAQLGRLAAVEDAIALVRGYGAAFWIFIQDLSQLKGVYPKWQTFLANSAQQFYGTADYDTAKYISDALGKYTAEFQTVSDSGSNPLQQASSQHFTARPLLTPDEVMRLGPRPIVLITGERPYLLDRVNYLVDAEYQGLADPNPFHAPVLARASA